jgi:ESX secretion system protein EccD
VAARAARLVTAAGVAIAVVAVVCSAMLLSSATIDLDQIGARWQVFFAGAALLLAGRSYRHAAARAALRTAGLGCWVVLSWVALAEVAGSGPERIAVLAGVAIGLAVLLVVVSVAAGRGWRSAWWARRAEVAEGLSGALTLASLFVATGFCRTIWELTSNVGF